MNRCPFATWIGSPNYGYPRGTHGQLRPLAICDHIMCGTLDGCDSWFKNPNAWASAHFGIGKNGHIHQYVDLDACAWANGVVNKPDPAIAHLYEGQNPNVITWSIEHEGYPWDKWTEEMLRADVKLKRWLYQQKPGLILVGHYQFDSVNKANCPGPNWPKELLAAKMIAGEEEEVPGFTEEQEERIKEIVNWCGPGMEMQARMAVASRLFHAGSIILAGDWGLLPGFLEGVKGKANQWHRWEGD